MERFYLSEFDQFLNQLKLDHPAIRKRGTSDVLTGDRDLQTAVRS